MQYVVLLAMAIFFGFAFEEFYNRELQRRPGGVRAFPLLSFAGAGLYLLEPRYAIAFTAGLLVLGAWLLPLVKDAIADQGDRSFLTVPLCAVVAYVLGPIALTQPMWLTIAFTVVAVLLVGSRARLHALATAVPFGEVLTIGQFLLLVGVVLPLLQNAPAIPYTSITPFKVWLAVVAVSTISYVSYLLQRYVLQKGGAFVTALLGGMYSSTATTIVFARGSQSAGYTGERAAGTVAATGMMYVRLLIVATIFNARLGKMLLVPTLVLAAVALAIALIFWRGAKDRQAPAGVPQNPLQLGTALIFAVLLIVFSVITSWATTHLGSAGLLALAGVVGFTDIDPFVLGLAQSSTIAVPLVAAAILIASSSNNVLKGVYAALFSRRRESLRPIAALAVLALGGVAAAWMVMK